MTVNSIGTSRFGVNADPLRFADEARSRRQVLGIDVNIVIEKPVIDMLGRDDACPPSRGEPV